MPAERSLLETLCLSSKLDYARLLLLVNRGGPIKRSLVLRKCPAPKARSSIHATLPSTFASVAPRAFCASSLQQLCLCFCPSGTLLAPSPAMSSTNKAQANFFFCLGCLCRLIAVGHAVSTSELCRERQRGRVSERNPNGNLTTTPPYRQDSDTLGHKMLAGAVDSALLRSKPPSGVAPSGRQSPSKSLEHPVLNIYYSCIPG